MVGLGEQFPSRSWMFPPVERIILIYFSFNTLSENYKPFFFLVWWIVRSRMLSIVQMKTVTGKYGSWEAGLELGVSVSLAGECFFFHAWCQRLHHLCSDHGVPVLKGNNVSLKIKFNIKQKVLMEGRPAKWKGAAEVTTIYEDEGKEGTVGAGVPWKH